MRDERGISSLALVLLLLVLGSLMLNGLNQRQRTHTQRITSESRAMRNLADAHSALGWGRMQAWQMQPAVQCRAHRSQPWRVCLRIFADRTLLLIAASGSEILWRSGAIGESGVTFSPHGWSDFCPLKEIRQCQMP